ncbi:MAG: methyltransferase [Candidatus Methanoperedens nitroreducens]|uniref:Methyltransferase n=1 Tax=Candidatus Methanoperedens nitratireducens TaxID=1392998 RepID=A0A0P7ZZI9_9EURY|nr:class I SAM-dependent methyltransferase [Candidatus Methanoperedens sp. BLZ2]KAB2947785.1 MAG: class I SAM-dependent methyltransferase [Candidatus Methanoperedens sp.]KPQ41011.1 MAG: methyltransferase [Candidatus Methanoperedens sp. BLZ1]
MNKKIFYENKYLQLNPSMHVEDIPKKFDRLMSVFNSDNKYKKVLDIGCGSGVLINMMANELFPEIAMGCDISLNILSQSKKLVPSNHYIRCDGLSLPFKNDTIDLVLITDLVEHVNQPDKLLYEVERVSKEMLIIIPIESGFFSDIAFKFMRLIGLETNIERYGHIHRFKSNKCKNLIEKSGFNIVNSKIMKSCGSQMQRTIFGKLHSNLSSLIRLVSKDIDQSLLGGYEYIAFCRK